MEEWREYFNPRDETLDGGSVSALRAPTHPDRAQAWRSPDVVAAEAGLSPQPSDCIRVPGAPFHQPGSGRGPPEGERSRPGGAVPVVVHGGGRGRGRGRGLGRSSGVGEADEAEATDGGGVTDRPGVTDEAGTGARGTLTVFRVPGWGLRALRDGWAALRGSGRGRKRRRRRGHGRPAGAGTGTARASSRRSGGVRVGRRPIEAGSDVPAG